MKNRPWVITGIAVLLVLGITMCMGWKTNAQQSPAKMEYEITDVVCNIKESPGMQIEAEILAGDELDPPVLSIKLTNDTGRTMDVVTDNIAYKEGRQWRKCTPAGAQLLERYTVLSKEQAEKMEQSIGEESCNILEIIQSPWMSYMDMAGRGCYRINIQFFDEDGGLAGSAYVEWAQR